MLRFRDTWPVVPSTLESLADFVLDPRHFNLPSGLSLEREHVQAREQRWELYRGRLLDPAHTRQMKTLEEWNLFLIEDRVRSPEPLLSLKFDAAERRLHVVRSLLCHVWEGYDSGGGVILSREATRWVRELTGTIVLAEINENELLDEMVCQVYHAVVGASRLPLTSVETPLPAFSLGRLGYYPSNAQQLAHSWRELIEATGNEPLSNGERAKRLETLLHSAAVEEMDELAGALSGSNVLADMVRMFNEVSLSPWTDLTDKALALLEALERQGYVTGGEAVDFLSARLLQTVRHLAAYDLVTFHHRGANYPDALLLDTVLKIVLHRVESTPELFHGDDSRCRLGRRALRQGWLQRRQHEGLPVPDAPTSPGENQRVLPPPHVRVPEDQILNTLKRRRILHEGDPLPGYLGPQGAEVFRQSIAELSEPTELRELGVALFLDRPLGLAKMPGEPDRTVLLSHRAFSRSLARRRLRLLVESEPLEAALESLEVSGVPLSRIAARPRPGAVSLADARQVAEDFVVMRTTQATVEDLLRQYNFGEFDELKRERGLLIVPCTDGVLTIFDAQMQPRLTLTPDASQGYRTRAGCEMLRAGLLLSNGNRAMPRLEYEPEA
jgi:hypothetical protein